MAFNPYNAINQIYKYKGQWADANKNGDENKKNDAAKKAQEYYAQLRSNNYGDVADELAGSDYEKSKYINDYYAKTGRTETRPYLYSAGKKYGLSQTDIDNLLQYDNDTGEIRFGGKNIGKPDAVVDGTSYWGDTSVLDNAVTDYTSRSGISQPKSVSVAQENDSLFKKYNQEYEDLKNTNPFTTDEAKAILAKYDLAGLQGRDNAAASGSSSNGGNIDSFSAANALRQQSALVNQGQQAVLTAYQQKLDNARNLLADMGVNIDRVYNQDETTKNNDLSRDIAASELTGNVHPNLQYVNNPFFNKDGTLINENIDYQSIIDNNSEKLKNATNASEKADLEATIKYAKQARAYKMQNNPAYAKYANTISLYAPDETADYKLSKEQLASNERIADKANQNQLDILQKQSDLTIEQEKAKKALNNPTVYYNYSGSNGAMKYPYTTPTSNGKGSNAADKLQATKKSDGTYMGETKVGDKNGKPILTLSQAQAQLNSGNLSPQAEYALTYYGAPTTIPEKATVDDKEVDEIVKMLNKDIADKYGDDFVALNKDSIDTYKLGNTDADYVIKKVLGADKYTDAQKKYILQNKFGITDGQINTVLRDNHY